MAVVVEAVSLVDEEGAAWGLDRECRRRMVVRWWWHQGSKGRKRILGWLSGEKRARGKKQEK